MICIGEPKVNPRATRGTILDHDITKRITIDITRVIPGGVRVGEETEVRSVRLPRDLRTGLARDLRGEIILPPIVRSFDRLVESVITGSGVGVREATCSFYRTLCREMRREFIRLAKPRTGRSAMLIGVCGYRDDMFSSENYTSGWLSDLRHWQVGLSRRVMEQLGIASGDCVIFSRFPATMVIPVEAVEMELEGNIVALPVCSYLSEGRITSAAYETGGDKDGDAYTIRTVHTEEAKTELREAFTKFWSGTVEQEIDRTSYTWGDQEQRDAHPDRVAQEKFLQKAAVGPTTLDWYAVFTVLMNCKRRGLEIGLTFEDVRKGMMNALESVFDLKHGNQAEPMALHSLLLGQKSLEEVSETLVKQGLDLSTIAKVMDMTGGMSVRSTAMSNPAYAITYGEGKRSERAIELLLKKTPKERPIAEVFSRLLFPFQYKTTTDKRR